MPKTLMALSPSGGIAQPTLTGPTSNGSVTLYEQDQNDPRIIRSFGSVTLYAADLSTPASGVPGSVLVNVTRTIAGAYFVTGFPGWQSRLNEESVREQGTAFVGF